MASPRPSHASVDPVKCGLAGSCPRCGRGKLFAGFLTVGRRCRSCDLDYAFVDTGDGPAVFVILIVGLVVVGLALWLEVTQGPPLWVHLVLWLPLTVVLALPLLRMLKGAMIALQYRNRAAEGQLDRDR